MKVFGASDAANVVIEPLCPHRLDVWNGERNPAGRVSRVLMQPTQENLLPGFAKR